MIGFKVYILNIDRQLIYLKFGVAGLNSETRATFSWTFPDGRVLPQNGLQGVTEIGGMDSGALLSLRSQSYGWSPNIPDAYIPQGRHVIRIKGIAPLSYIKLGIYDAY